MRNKIVGVLGASAGAVSAIVHGDIAKKHNTVVAGDLKKDEWYEYRLSVDKEMRDMRNVRNHGLKQPKRCAWKNKYEDLGRK